MFARNIPLTPANTPEIAHAQASTRRTGTPTRPLISRSLASARIDRPSRVRLRKTTMPNVTATPRPKAMARVAVTRTPISSNTMVSVGKRRLRGHSPQMNSQKPSTMSAKPSVATARTIGSLWARRGAIIRP